MSFEPDLSGHPELYLQKLADPLGGREFRRVAMRSGKAQLIRRDPDFRPVYKGAGPLYYSIVVAPSGLAADETLFGKPHYNLFNDLQGLQDLVADCGYHEQYNQPRDIALAAQSYALAIQCAQHLNIGLHEQASLTLRGAWMHLEWQEQGFTAAGDHARLLKRMARQLFEQAYSGEDLSGTRLGYAGTAFQIGELARQEGDFEMARRWLGMAVRDKGANAELLRAVRLQLDETIEQFRSGGGVLEPDEADAPDIATAWSAGASADEPAAEPAAPEPRSASQAAVETLSLELPPPQLRALEAAAAAAGTTAAELAHKLISAGLAAEAAQPSGAGGAP